jgi:hypothetical protein
MRQDQKQTPVTAPWSQRQAHSRWHNCKTTNNRTLAATTTKPAIPIIAEVAHRRVAATTTNSYPGELERI